MAVQLSPSTNRLSWVNFLTAVFAFALTFIVVECMLRVFHVYPTNFAAVKTDPLIGWRYVANSPYRFFAENDHAVYGKMNGFGWHDQDWAIEKKSGVIRIAVLGDSMVEAMQVEESKNFTSLLEKQIGAEVMNFGRSGMSQAEEFLILQNEVVRFNPDLVVLVFNPTNDIDDIHPRTDVHKVRPYFILQSDGSLKLDTSFNISREYAQRSFINPIRAHSLLFGLGIEKYAQWRKERRYNEKKARQVEAAIVENRSLSGYLSLATSAPDPIYAENYRLNKKLIQEMNSFCRKRAIHFVLVSLSTPDYQAPIQRKHRQLDPSFSPYFFDEDLEHFAEEQGIPFVGLQKIFEQTDAPLFWSHLNYQGHKVIAQTLAKNELLSLEAKL